MPAILLHSNAGLRRVAVLGAVLAGLMFWFAADPGIQARYRGPPLLLDTILGHAGLRACMLAFGVCCVAGTLAAARLLLSPDRLAARADGEGVVLRGLWGTVRFARSEIRAVRLQSVRSRRRTHHYVRIEAAGRRRRLMSVATIDGGLEAATAWIAAAGRLLAGPPPAPSEAPPRAAAPGRRTFGRAPPRPL